MIAISGDTRIWLVAGATDMRRGFDGLAALVQTQLAEDPFLCVGREYAAAHREHVAKRLIR
jgi:transposase